MSAYDPTDIRNQERVKADSNLRNKLAKDTEEADLKRLMRLKWGRRIVWRLLDRAGVYRLSFDGNPLVMAFNEGNRNEGLRVLAQINTLCPELYHLMVKEQTNDNRNLDADDH